MKQIDALSLDQLDPDSDGYPSEQTLAWLEHCDLLTESLNDFLAVLSANWHWGLKRKDWKDGTIKLYLATGGWSGNESVIRALSCNGLFWSLCWDRSVRGGGYWFTITPALQRMWKYDSAL